MNALAGLAAVIRCSSWRIVGDSGLGLVSPLGGTQGGEELLGDGQERLGLDLGLTGGLRFGELALAAGDPMRDGQVVDQTRTTPPDEPAAAILLRRDA